MSYCRFGPNSDVYVFPTYGYAGEPPRMYECCGCRLTGHNERFTTIEGILSHLGDHVDDGDLVPDYAFDVLHAEQAAQQSTFEADVPFDPDRTED